MKTSVEDRLARSEGPGGGSDVRALVVLHLYYFDLWPKVRAYLANLAQTDYDLFVTYPRERADETVLRDVRAFKPAVTCLACPNAGFDVGPFVEVLSRIDLADYDLVFKLQTKGCDKPTVYAYGQVFKGDEWFRCLYDGILSRENLPRVLTALGTGEAELAAAANLLVPDQYDRQWFVRRACARLRIGVPDNYRFVAGTCFAIRASALRPLRELGLTIADFAPSRRGEFSLGHVLERVMCFPAHDRMLGLPVAQSPRAGEIARIRDRNSRYALLEDVRVRINPDFQLEFLEPQELDGYEIVTRRLKDLSFVRDGVCRYATEGAPRCDWCRREPSERDVRLPIVSDEGYVLEGACRCAALEAAHGPDFPLRVLRLRCPRPPGSCCGLPDGAALGRQIAETFALADVVPLHEAAWKRDSVLGTMFFSARTADGRPCFVKCVQFAAELAAAEDRWGRAFFERLPDNCAEPLGLRVLPDGRAIVVQTRIEGRTLAACLAANAVTSAVAAHLADEMVAIADALQDLGISHRDIHPDNLMVGADGHLRLLDFQFATPLKAVRETTFAARHWRLTLAGLGNGSYLARGVWNDRHALALCLDRLPAFDGKDRVRARLVENLGAVTRVARFPFRERLAFARRWLSLAYANFHRRRRGKPEAYVELEQFCRAVALGTWGARRA